MTRAHRIESWIALLAGILIVVGVVLLIRWQRMNPISLRGAIIVSDSDPQKQLPIADVVISAGDLGEAESKSSSSGLFIVRLSKRIRKGHAIILHFRHPQYRPLDLNDVVSNKLYVVHLVPVTSQPVSEKQPQVTVSNVRVRYTLKAKTELNVGSAVKTFEIQNKGNVACKGEHPCSPDGRWKAAIGQVSLDAGEGNEFRDVRASCIAGPCPFTRIDTDTTSHNGQIMVATARDWSDTATFLLEAEVFRPMVSANEHWSYPVVFGDGLNFTLPSSAQSVSIQADVNGQTVIFPLGPTLFLSWAACETGTDPNNVRAYRCTPKSGYRFQ